MMFVCRGFDGTILSDLSPDDVLENARRTRMILSRHGRIDYHSWEDRDVAEMRLALDDLLYVIKQEAEATKAAAAGRGG